MDEVLFKILLGKASEYISKPTLEKIREQLKDPGFRSKVYPVVEDYKRYIIGLSTAGLQILDVKLDLITDAIKLGAKYGLFITDSIHLSTMKRYGIRNIATNDSDFERIEFVKVWKP